MISQRINSLSTRYLGFYKNSVLIFLIGLAVFLLGVKVKRYSRANTRGVPFLCSGIYCS